MVVDSVMETPLSDLGKDVISVGSSSGSKGATHYASAACLTVVCFGLRRRLLEAIKARKTITKCRG
jgi:hypothetical protein